MKHPSIVIVLLIFMVASINSFAKKIPDDVWNPGTLVLKNNEILKGKINFSPEYDIVQIYIEGRIKTFSPYNVNYFQFYDELREINRIYAVLDNNENEKKRRKNRITFYEVLLDGHMTLLRKEEIHYFQDYEIIYNAIDLVPSLASKHYILFNEQIATFKNFKKEIIPLMNDKTEKIETYIRENNLNVHDLVSQILIIDYYNYLKDPLYRILNTQMFVKE